jgi:hypothetical protein
MRAILIHCLLATACAMGLAACGDDSDDDGGEVSRAGKGGSGGDGGAGTGGDGGAGAGGDGEAGTGGGGSIACTEAATECPVATAQLDGVPCCTTEFDTTAPRYTARTAGVCGLHFPDRVPCFELAAPGKLDNECPVDLDQGWGHNPGCCHTTFTHCGILNGDTGCTLYRATALKPDGTPIGMDSGGFECTPD